jgi:hypothetical protein
MQKSKTLPHDPPQNALSALPHGRNLLRPSQPHNLASAQPALECATPSGQTQAATEEYLFFRSCQHLSSPISPESNQQNSFESPAKMEAASAFPQHTPHTYPPPPRPGLGSGKGRFFQACCPKSKTTPLEGYSSL